MADRFAAFLKDLDDPRRYARRRDVAVFDAHTEEEGGKVVRSFDRKRLQEIADASNARAAKGQPCPLTLGHTDPDPKAPEKGQPEIVGYARGFRVGFDRRLGRWTLRADFYLRKDREKAAEGYPRVSVELWPTDKFLDPIALLRRTPQRDVGQWSYGMSARGGEVIRYSMSHKPGAAMHDDDLEDDDLDAPGGDAGLDAPGGDDGLDAPGGDEPAEPSHEEKVERFMKHVCSHPDMEHFVKHYAMGAAPAAPAEEPAHDPTAPPDAAEEPEPYAAFPSATNGAVPGADDEALRHAKRDAARKARGKELAAALVKDGFVLPADEAREALQFSKLGPAERKERDAYVRRAYRKAAPVGGAPVRVKEGPVGGKKKTLADMDEGQLRRALAYMKKRQEAGSAVTWEQAAKKVMAAGN